METRTTSDKVRVRGEGIIVGLLACLAIVWQSSQAAFSATTQNDNNTLNAGSVSLTDSRNGTAIINASNLAPGGPVVERCIGIRYIGSLTPMIKVYADKASAREREGGTWSAWSNTPGPLLDDYINLTIQVNDTDMALPPSSETDCAPVGYGTYHAAPVLAGSVGSLRSFINSNDNFSNGLGLTAQWPTVTANQYRIFKFTYSLDASAPNGAQSDGVEVDIVWEARNT